MSLEQAKLFVERLKTDSVFCQQVRRRGQGSGHDCTLSEIRQAKRQALIQCEKEHCTISSNLSKEGLCPYVSMPHGYEHWVG
jgi:hypothetical protein